jgi:uncharacterized membrane protein
MEQIIAGHFDSHQQAETTVRALSEAGVALKDVSIIAQNLQTTEQVQGFITTGDVATTGAGVGAWYGGFFGLLVGSAFLWIPGLGPLVVAGALASSFIGMLEGAAVGAVSGGLIGALMGYGLTRDKALKYETTVRAGNYLLLVHAEDAKVSTVRRVLEQNGIKDLEVSPLADNTQVPA